mmetsp:Transcript_30620/g.57205  ORF Transcript_30620/g.57205 Transcript_30620/m.57205 type:complete len:250 (-) Transcript_30620:1560-2309(-)
MTTLASILVVPWTFDKFVDASPSCISSSSATISAAVAASFIALCSFRAAEADPTSCKLLRRRASSSKSQARSSALPGNRASPSSIVVGDTTSTGHSISESSPSAGKSTRSSTLLFLAKCLCLGLGLQRGCCERVDGIDGSLSKERNSGRWMVPFLLTSSRTNNFCVSPVNSICLAPLCNAVMLRVPAFRWSKISNASAALENPAAWSAAANSRNRMRCSTGSPSCQTTTSSWLKMSRSSPGAALPSYSA